MKIVFLGTPEFGRKILAEINKENEVVLVVTQPDKKQGRGGEIKYSPVKEYAVSHNIPVFQPISIRKEYTYILQYDFDLIVSAAYGQIVGTKLLFYPKFKSINVHGSLLPKGRGGAPIQRSIMNGDKKTGITIMYMGRHMDDGDILMQEEIDISDNDNSDSLFQKLAALGAKMINPAIKKLAKEELSPKAQDNTEVTFSYNLTPNDEKLDLCKSARLVSCQVRALAPKTGANFLIGDTLFKIYSCEVIDVDGAEGVILEVQKDSFSVGCRTGAIKITEIKPAGKRLMKVKDYLNGKGKEIIKQNIQIK